VGLIGLVLLFGGSTAQFVNMELVIVAGAGEVLACRLI